MAEIVSLRDRDAAAHTGEPDPEIIAMLEACLARARRGEVIGLGIVVVNPARVLGTQWRQVGLYRNDLIAGALRLLDRMKDDAAEDEFPAPVA